MNTYEITLTVVTDTNRNGMEADARWLADLMTSKSVYHLQECWIERVEKVATYDVRDPDGVVRYDIEEDVERTSSPEWELQDRDEINDYLNREGDPAFNGAFNNW